MNVLVTPRSLTRDGHPALDRLTEAGYAVILSTPGQFPTEDELHALLPGCVGYLAGVEPITAAVLDAATELKAISRNGTGIDAIDMAAAERNGIRVLRAAGANARGVAELAVGHILAATRSIPQSDAAMKDGRWERRTGIELRGRTLGLVGCGTIGRLVAGFAAAFDMEVLAFDPCPDPAFHPAEGFAWADLEAVLSAADIISLHCPALPDNRPLIDGAAIEAMKDGVYLVNTARGSLLDDEAVLAALDAGTIAGVALDAFTPEPPGDRRLVAHERVVATPHVGGYTIESVDRAVAAAVDNLLAAIG